MLNGQANAHPCGVAPNKNKLLLPDAIFYMSERLHLLHLEYCSLRQCPGQREVAYFSVKSVLNGACPIEIVNSDLVDQRTAERVINALVFLAAQCHCNGSAQNLALLCSLEFFQSLLLRGLKQGNDR